MTWPVGVWWPDSGPAGEAVFDTNWPLWGSLTTGLDWPPKPLAKETGENVSRAIEDLLLGATLAEYMLPPYMLVLRLEYP